MVIKQVKLWLFICIPVTWDLTYTQSFQGLILQYLFFYLGLNKYNMGDTMNE